MLENSAWEQLVNRLHSPEDREKIEWAIGSIVSGDSKKIQKFMVFSGAPATGKSTVMNIIRMMFDDRNCVTLDPKSLTDTRSAFQAAVFKSGPLVAFSDDADLSRIADGSLFNSIISHDTVTIAEKYKPYYSKRLTAFLFVGTTGQVDLSSVALRRVLDVRTTGDIFDSFEYGALMKRVEFELDSIAHHCLEVYRSLGADYYKDYRPSQVAPS